MVLFLIIWELTCIRFEASGRIGVFEEECQPIYSDYSNDGQIYLYLFIKGFMDLNIVMRAQGWATFLSLKGLFTSQYENVGFLSVSRQGFLFTSFLASEVKSSLFSSLILITELWSSSRRRPISSWISRRSGWRQMSLTTSESDPFFYLNLK